MADLAALLQLHSPISDLLVGASRGERAEVYAVFAARLEAAGVRVSAPGYTWTATGPDGTTQTAGGTWPRSEDAPDPVADVLLVREQDFRSEDAAPHGKLPSEVEDVMEASERRYFCSRHHALCVIRETHSTLGAALAPEPDPASRSECRPHDDWYCECGHRYALSEPTPQPDPASRELREALDSIPRLWWCSGWGTLNEKRHHGNETACAGESCGNVAYVRDVDLRAALAATENPTEKVAPPALTVLDVDDLERAMRAHILSRKPGEGWPHVRSSGDPSNGPEYVNGCDDLCADAITREYAALTEEPGR